MQSFLDFFMMLMNMAQTYNHQQYTNPYAQPPYTLSPQNFQSSPFGVPPSPFGTPPNPFGTPPSPFGTPPSPFGPPFSPFGSPPPNFQFIPGKVNNEKPPELAQETQKSQEKSTSSPIFPPHDITAIPPVLNIPSAINHSINQSVLEVKMNKCCPINYYYSQDSSRRMLCKKHSSDLDRIVGKTKVFKTVRQYACEASMGQYVDDLSQLDINGDGFLKYKGETYEKYCMDFDILMSKFIIIKCKGKKVDAQGNSSDGKESRVMNILKKRAQRLNEVDRPAIKKPKLKNSAKRTTTIGPVNGNKVGVTLSQPVGTNTRPTSRQAVAEDEYESSEYYYDSVEELGDNERAETKNLQTDDSVEEIEYEEEEYEEVEFVPLPSSTTTTTTTNPQAPIRISTRIKLKATTTAVPKKVTTTDTTKSTFESTKASRHLLPSRPALFARSALVGRPSVTTSTTTTTTQKTPVRILKTQKPTIRQRTTKRPVRTSKLHQPISSEEYEEEYEVEYEYEE